MSDGGRTAPSTFDRRNWIRDTREYPAEPCITPDCQGVRVVLGYCQACAAVALTNRGVLRRRTRALLVLLATDEDLSSPAAWSSWKATLSNAVADVADTLDHPDDHPDAYSTTQCPLCGNQPEQTTDDIQEHPPEPASPDTIPDAEILCRHCPAKLYPWETTRGTCTACHRHHTEHAA